MTSEVSFLHPSRAHAQIIHRFHVPLPLTLTFAGKTTLHLSFECPVLSYTTVAEWHGYEHLVTRLDRNDSARDPTIDRESHAMAK